MTTLYGTVGFVVLDDAFRNLCVSLEIGNLNIEAGSRKPDGHNPKRSY